MEKSLRPASAARRHARCLPPAAALQAAPVASTRCPGVQARLLQLANGPGLHPGDPKRQTVHRHQSIFAPPTTQRDVVWMNTPKSVAIGWTVSL